MQIGMTKTKKNTRRCDVQNRPTLKEEKRSEQKNKNIGAKSWGWDQIQSGKRGTQKDPTRSQM